MTTAIVVVAALAASADRASAASTVALDHGTLTVKGDAAADRRALRARPSAPRTLQVDLGDDGTADFAVKLRKVERVRVRAGADTIAVGDLSATAVDEVNVNLEPALGAPGGDGQPGSVIATGTDGDDAIAVAGANGTVKVTGLAATIGISHAEAADDSLALDTRAGNDTVDSSGLAPNTIQLTTD